MLTKRGRWDIIINVVSARAATTAILENDIVKTRQIRTKVRGDREGGSRNESEQKQSDF